MRLFRRLVFHLQPVILLSSIPITFAGILYAWNFIDPFSNYQPEIDLDISGEQFASLTPIFHAIVRCAFAVLGSAAGFYIAIRCAHQLPLGDDNLADDDNIRPDGS